MPGRKLTIPIEVRKNSAARTPVNASAKEVQRHAPIPPPIIRRLWTPSQNGLKLSGNQGGSRLICSAPSSLACPVNTTRNPPSPTMTNIRQAIFSVQINPKIGIAITQRNSKPANVGVDAAARIQSSSAGRIKLRNTLPPLASNDLLCGPSLKSFNARNPDKSICCLWE